MCHARRNEELTVITYNILLAFYLYTYTSSWRDYVTFSAKLWHSLLCANERTLSK